MSNILVDSRSFPRYEVRWKLAENENLSGFDVEYCMQSCNIVFIQRSDQKDSMYSFEYDLEAFFTQYNITVTAIFTQPLGVKVRRTLVYKTVSEVGEPSAVTNLRKVSQAGPVVYMKWDKPAMPNGPLSHYRLFIDECVEGLGEIE